MSVMSDVEVIQSLEFTTDINCVIERGPMHRADLDVLFARDSNGFAPSARLPICSDCCDYMEKVVRRDTLRLYCHDRDAVYKPGAVLFKDVNPL